MLLSVAERIGLTVYERAATPLKTGNRPPRKGGLLVVMVGPVGYRLATSKASPGCSLERTLDVFKAAALSTNLSVRIR